ncbi:hypothetical protein ACFLV3_00975 [Chloroflexota bacterium]
MHDNQLWSIDAADNRLLSYADSLTLPIVLISPSDEAQGIGDANVNLDWEVSDGATSYRWQLDYDTDLSTVPTGFEGTTRASSARSPALESATEYYWRVRVTEPVLSPWSAKWSFTSSLGSEVVAPELYSPKAGASGVPLKPVFQWSAVAGAESYELLVSDDVSFVDPLVIKIGDYALPATAWQCDVSLERDSSYYWKVRAVGSDTHGAWSAVGAFTTGSSSGSSSSQASKPESSPPPESSSLVEPSSMEPPSQPQPLPQSAAPEWEPWLVRFGVALLLTLVAILVTMIVLTVRVRRL